MEGPDEVIVKEKQQTISNEEINIEYLGVKIKATVWMTMFIFLMLLVFLLIYLLHLKKKVNFQNGLINVFLK